MKTPKRTVRNSVSDQSTTESSFDELSPVQESQISYEMAQFTALDVSVVQTPLRWLPLDETTGYWGDPSYVSQEDSPIETVGTGFNVNPELFWYQM